MSYADFVSTLRNISLQAGESGLRTWIYQVSRTLLGSNVCVGLSFRHVD
jgi:hypothetical protein